MEYFWIFALGIIVLAVAICSMVECFHISKQRDKDVAALSMDLGQKDCEIRCLKEKLATEKDRYNTLVKKIRDKSDQCRQESEASEIRIRGGSE